MRNRKYHQSEKSRVEKVENLNKMHTLELGAYMLKWWYMKHDINENDNDNDEYKTILLAEVVPDCELS